MMKTSESGSAPVLAYVLLLIGFISLGLFVAALGTGSNLAVLAGIGVVAGLAGAVAGFRRGARTLAQSRAAGDPGDNVSVFSIPLRRDEVDRYLEQYRGADVPQPRPVMTVLAGEESTSRGGASNGRKPAHAVSERLSA
ncbi:hypothetical protein M2272_003634 [Mycobacterium frederiksbergense]|uniref:Uncharacterized protein n=1 Tax=Mycolicibacterium frederiksbergense TaxID=117567 RepID=A0ABT6L2Z2_9MYCO|nr:hypothetical protein [Mycolicibacterium frederiksbergense]MDH6196981.1 hypothetical protein [Mycolicibacterium frederiksbergense]